MSETIPTLPSGPLDLLVKAALAPEETARAAWQRWRRFYTLDETPWNEVRLLGNVAKRVAWLEPEADILPRIRGIQKFLYTQTQLCFVGATPGLRALAEAGIPMMFLKGAARIVLQESVARERLARDIDVLVPVERKDEAYAVLTQAGWELRGESWQQHWRQLDATASHHAWSLGKGSAEIDLHHFSNNLNRLLDDDAGLWQRSTLHDWRGMRVHIPSATDSLLSGIVHGLRWSRECNADWIIDVFAPVSSGGVDWSLLLAEARARQVEAILHAGLDYLKRSLAAPVPEDVLQSLAAAAAPAQRQELAIYASTPVPADFRQNAPLLGMAIARSGTDRSRLPARATALCVVSGSSLPFAAKIDIISYARGAERAELAVRFQCALPPGSKLVGSVSILGLVLDVKPGIVSASPGTGNRCDFVFTLERRLLTRRGVRRLHFSVAPAGDLRVFPWGGATQPVTAVAGQPPASSVSGPAAARRLGDTMCVLPWINLHVATSGAISPCCEFREEVANLSESTLASAWQGEGLRKVREALLQGQPPGACIKCFDREASEGQSLRKKSNSQFAAHLSRILGSDAPLRSAPDFPVALDLRFSNLCNFKCRTCWHGSSSKWFSDGKAIGLTAGSRAEISSFETVEEFLAQVKPGLPRLEYIYFAGGEPLLQPEHYLLLARLIELGRTDISLEYNSNLSTTSFKDSSVLDLWSGFQDVTLGASVDAAGELGAILRNGFDWSVFASNVARVRERCPHVKIRFGITVSALNIGALHELFTALARDCGAGAGDFRLHSLQDPVFYRSQVLPAPLKAEVEASLRGYLQGLGGEAGSADPDTVALHRSIEGLIAFMHAKDRSAEFPRLVQRTRQLDGLRQEDSRQAIPALGSFLSGQAGLEAG